MRGIGPASPPLLRAAASVLLALVFVAGAVGGKVSGPRPADDLAAFIGTAEGVLAQTTRIKLAKPALSPSDLDVDDVDAAFAHVASPCGTGPMGQRQTTSGRFAPTPPCHTSPPIRAPPLLS